MFSRNSFANSADCYSISRQKVFVSILVHSNNNIISTTEVKILMVSQHNRNTCKIPVNMIVR